MKFCENGPNIPNSLIRERDAGKVVFICGAGVSMQSSGLPSFLQLASRVMDELLVPEEDKIRNALNYNQDESKNRYLSIDRIFSQLEQDYDTYDIESAVSKVLSLSRRADTTCHEIICDLAKTPKGHTKLITTNFDNLFSRAAKCNEMIYPELSTIDDEDKSSQLVYLHGKCVGENIPPDSELVLSSRSFGKAYLVDGRASQLLKSVFNKFTVVFVGYSSDDPPIQYLLEALAQVDSTHYNVYAFQKEEHEINSERWLYQKIKPIYFNEFDDLWETLNHWRHYANDVESWTDSVLNIADKGPTSLADWQRSQVAYIASSTSGIKAISKRNPPLPAKWLFCFDASFRYASPKNDIVPGDKLSNPDPFKALGLFEDTLRSGKSSKNFANQPRNKPERAWDAFDGTGEYPEHPSDPTTPLGNSNLDYETKLYNRYLSDWISRISDRPEASYWAIYREALDQDLCKMIITKIKTKLRGNPIFEELEWKTILENWGTDREKHEDNLFKLNTKIKKHGWTSSYVAEYKSLSKPLLVGISEKRINAIFSNSDEKVKLLDLVKVKINYRLKKLTQLTSTAPGTYATKLVTIERKNLNFVVRCLKQNSFYDRWRLPPLCESNSQHRYSRQRDLDMQVFRYIERLNHLIKENPHRAKLEFKSWPVDDLGVFGRLRIWAASDRRIVNDHDAAELFSCLPPELFWGRLHRADLRHSLKARWSSLPSTAISVIEKRILRGKEPNVDTNIHENIENSRYMAIQFGLWIVENRLKVSDEFTDSLSNLQAGDRVKPEADNTTGTTDGKIRHRGRGDSYSGERERQLSSILISLREKAKMGEYSPPEWYLALSAYKDQEWTNRHIWYTAKVLRNAPDYLIERSRNGFTEWFANVVARYDGEDVFIRDELFSRLVSMIMNEKVYDVYADIGQQLGERRWSLLNDFSHSGLLAKSLFSYSEVSKLSSDSCPPGFWLDAAARLLSLHGNNGRYALFYFMSQIELLYKMAPGWTRSHIFEKNIDRDHLTAEAFWTGLVDRNQENFDIDFELYMEIRPHLITRLSRSLPSESRITQGLSVLLLMGWLHRKDGRRWVSNSDIRTILRNSSGEFRQCILIGLRNYVSKSISNGNKNWFSDIEQFFMKVWPRTRAAKSNTSIKEMLDIIFIDPKYSTALSSIIVPRIGKITRNSLVLGHLLEYHSDILKDHPSVAVDFLYILFKDYSGDFPSEVGNAIIEIGKNYPKIRKDDRFGKVTKKISK